MSPTKAQQKSLTHDVIQVLTVLNKKYPTHPMHEAFGDDPYKMLVAVMLSQRATDRKTIEVASLLFLKAPTVIALHTLPIFELENIIKPIGFFHQKAKHLHAMADTIINTFSAEIPRNEQDLISLPGVGPKTAHIIMSVCFNNPRIAVDVHAHRIPNRLGWISTTSVDESEQQLEKIVPKKLWGDVNRVFVQHGQNTCKPRKPLCFDCPVEKWCKKHI